MGDINRLKLVLVEQNAQANGWQNNWVLTLQLFQSGVLIHLNHLWKRLSK